MPIDPNTTMAVAMNTARNATELCEWFTHNNLTNALTARICAESAIIANDSINNSTSHTSSGSHTVLPAGYIVLIIGIGLLPTFWLLFSNLWLMPRLASRDRARQQLEAVDGDGDAWDVQVVGVEEEWIVDIEKEAVNERKEWRST
ncbi:hypothetical protein PMZ80_010248 [Knufia obscura]|uniref:Uncharacterized protein n=1 Tax=Knufia obscura TaxID=1635080 RepID=A0ABR0RBP2_9EURO|nr:hypothetical protein PMZ80_010248 [Knufia obscura]